MRSRRAGLAHVAALLSCAGLVAACAGGGAHNSQAKPSEPAVSPSISVAPSTAPPKAKKVSSPDSLGAKRVIPVPKSLAAQQLHRLLAVDGQTTLLDAGPGTKARPLLLVLHGMGEDAVEMRSQTGFTALAALTGFDVAYPNAPQDPGATTVAVLTRASVKVPAVTATPTVSPSVSPSTTPTPTPTHSPTPSPSKASPTPLRTATPTPTRTIVRPTVKPSPSPKKRPRPTPAPKRPSPLVAGTRAWNAGMCCALALRNDVGYLVDVVHAVEASVPVDLTRVYVVGFSNGGMMALRAICSAPETFAAAGSVSGPFLGTTCEKAVWRHIAAAPDPIVPPAGGVSPGAPALGVVRDWCGCTWPSTETERARFGPFASVYVSPTGGHSWPTPTNANWSFDPERDLWGYVSRFHL
jgi:predicted esterase